MPWKKYPEAERARFWEELQTTKRTSFAEVCRRFGISRRTGYKWRRRGRVVGPVDWSDRSHRRHGNLRQKAWWADTVLAAKRGDPRLGARKLRWVVRQLAPGRRAPSVRTLHRWLHEQGLVRTPRRVPPAGPWRRARALIQARAPNDVWSLDFKGSFLTADGTRVNALTVCDVYSRMVLIVCHVEPNEQSVRRVFARLFRERGRPRALLMDRGAPWCGHGPYRWTRLSVWWLRLGIWPQFTRRARPQDNAAHEQMHRILKAQTAQPPAPTLRAQQQRFNLWVRYYNERRAHATHADQHPPAKFYRPSPRGYPCPLLAWAYPRRWLRLHGTRSGYIRWRGGLFAIGRAFYRAPLGLRPCADGSALVYLGPYLLGQIHPAETTLRPVQLYSVQRGRGFAPPSALPVTPVTPTQTHLLPII